MIRRLKTPETSEIKETAGPGLGSMGPSLYSVLEATGEVVFGLDRGNHITHINANCRQTGYRSDELLGKNIFRLVHPADIRRLADSFRECLKGKKAARDLRFRLRHQAGDWRWYTASVAPFFDGTGQYRYTTGMARDITAQVEREGQEREKEASLRESEGRYKKFVQQISGGVWRFGLRQPMKLGMQREAIIEHFYRNCYIAECNDAMAQMYGFENQEEILDKDCEFFLPRSEGASLAFFNDFIDNNFQLKNYLSFEKDIYGNPKVFLNNVMAHIENGYIIHTWGTQRDITEMRQAEHTIRLREEQLRVQAERNTKILNSITDGFIALDNEGTIVMWNQKMEEVFGQAAADVIGRPMLDLFSMYRNTPAYSVILDAYRQKQQVHTEHFLKERNRWVEAVVYPFTDVCFIYFKDITARKRRELVMQLQKDVLSYNATPGTTLAGTAQYLIHGLQKLLPDARIAIRKADEKEVFLHALASSNLPAKFSEATACTAIGYARGSCGTAAHLKTSVFSPHIAADLLWEDYWALMREVNIQAAFSFPIINNRNQVLATLSLYFDHPRELRKAEQKAIDHILPVLSLIMEKRNAEEETRLSNERFILINKATNEGIVDHNLLTGQTVWGDGLSRLTGYELTEKEGSLGFWMSKVHADDVPGLLQLANSLHLSGNTLLKEVQFRLLRADGSYAHISATGYIVRDESCRPVRIVGALRDITGQKKMEQQLIREMVNKQKAIHKASLEGSEKEREAISRELHDNVNQILSATKLYLEIARKDEDKRELFLDRSIQFIMSSIAEIRKLSRSLSSPTLGDLGLKEAITTLVQELLYTEKLKIHFTYAKDLPATFDDTRNLTLYRIVQEQLTNILKYARTETTFIDLKKRADKLVLTIRDEGVGFDRKKVKKGLGLSNIANRASLLNGTARIRSAPGKGCTLTVTIPLEGSSK
ncbi:PAS domain S-box protein [Paraflavisolibacter sp. H34]|uniref:PAS domain S-box protein n=1 Tax=Huijunlia imazamoxiresistens TaxID=3127457 RepID=UPI00301A40C6